jgi:hypothetical protein
MMILRSRFNLQIYIDGVLVAQIIALCAGARCGQWPVQLHQQPTLHLLYVLLHADQILIGNPSYPGTSLSSTSNSNPYLLAFSDVHSNLDYTSVVLGGLSTEGTMECKFALQAGTPTSTQVLLTLTVIDTNSRFTQMQFFLLLVGTEAAGQIEAHQFCTSLRIQPRRTTSTIPTRARGVLRSIALLSHTAAASRGASPSPTC